MQHSQVTSAYRKFDPLGNVFTLLLHDDAQPVEIVEPWSQESFVSVWRNGATWTAVVCCGPEGYFPQRDGLAELRKAQARP